MQLLTIIIFAFISCTFAFIDRISRLQDDLPVQACLEAVSDGNIAVCGKELATKLYKLHHWGKGTPDNDCGFPCTGKIKGRFSKWEWVWDGQFRCDSKAPGIVGEATKKSRDGAKEWAIKDFVQKAIAAGHIKAEDIKC